MLVRFLFVSVSVSFVFGLSDFSRSSVEVAEVPLAGNDPFRKAENEEQQERIDPYMDETGRICQDKIEMMEDVEYENQIHCKVQMQKTCQFINSPATSEDQACHTMYHKECQTVYRPHMTKVNVRVCPEGAVETIAVNDKTKEEEQKASNLNSDISKDSNLKSDVIDATNLNSVVIDVRPSPPGMVQSSNCINGRRKVCLTKYETECSTEMTNHEMTEDHPKCRVEKVSKCDGEGANCLQVPAMRCRIEQRTVIKSKPETKCQRIPREFCHKEDCKEAEDEVQNQNNSKSDDSLHPKCYFRQQIVNEVVPEEKCNYRPERVCHPVLNANSRDVRALSNVGDPQNADENASRKRICEMVPQEKCENKRMNPKRVLKPMKKRICRFPRANSSYDRRIMKMMKLDFSGHHP